MIPAKVFACVLAVNILSASTRWDHIIGALKRFRFPDLFIFVFDITIKYIVMLGEFALQMLYALKLRSVGKNRSKYGSIGGVGGTLFIKSRDMSEDMYYAMECRGFTGEYRADGQIPLHRLRRGVYPAQRRLRLAVRIFSKSCLRCADDRT
jgi:cobalt/nickel transport system permease protein